MKYRKIIALGDSHAQSLAVHHQAKTVQMGPVTLYQYATLNREGIRFDIPNIFKDWCNETINQKDVLLVYCLGEIDIRCNWNKQINELKKDEDQLIKNLVDEFFITVLPIHNPFGFISIPPAVNANKMINKFTGVNSFPVRGSNEDRSRWVKKLNHYLKQKCLENNSEFIDVWEYYADENGLLKYELSDTNVHIGDSCYIAQEIEKLIKL